MKALIRLITIGTLLLGIFTIASFMSMDIPALSVEKQIAKHVVSYNVIMLGNQRIATGFHLEYEGKVYIVTNKHVCDHSQKLYNHDYIQFEDYVGEIIAIDDEHDLCLVTSNRSEGLKLSDKPSVPMEDLILVGHPRGLGKTIRKGRHVSLESISASWIGPGKHEAILASLIAYGGNSGSPVCNTNCNVVAVLFAGSPRFHTETLLVPLSYLKSFLAIYAR